MTGRGLIFAAPASGSGKTVLVAALLRLLARRGVRVAAAKLGPDYIDPTFHAAASRTACFNIDLWAMRPARVTALLGRMAGAAELVVVEGVMGLFDGAGDGSGSTADFAALSGLPVILVVDARGQAASVGALLRGFATHRPDVPIAGVIFNRVGGAGHEEALRRAAAPLDIPVLGAVRRAEELILPERHLGLVQASEHGDLDSFLDAAADRLAQSVDIEALMRLGRAVARVATEPLRPAIPPLGQRIAVARDAAFAFAYPALLEAWHAAGVELAMFSPLADESPDTQTDAVYLPGGYPELYAGKLAGNADFLAGLSRAAAGGAVIFGECGGYMTLGGGMIDSAGRRHAMAGLLPLESSFAQRRLHLGYRAATLTHDGPLGPAGEAYRGHEFHYATIVDEGPGDALFDCRDSRGNALGPTGRRRGNIFGSFVHLIEREEPARDQARLAISA
ncbi:MAG: cobyrinic acid a,c-diamide synthase [Rhodospirillaceae bacterium]|jgi:cobyrinic acid a,c-diamide synthase|nr:cobyrinic acid a,c-diamide synthase [Rhodospirillaceae bacterium]